MAEAKEYASLAKALKDFQAKAPTVEKTKTANIGKYSYKYADLADMWNKIRKPLTDCGLSVIQIPTTLNGEHALKTMLLHETGESIKDVMRLPVSRETSPQNLGSAITYAKRYMLGAMLGIVTEDDNDAQNLRQASTEEIAKIKKAAFETGVQTAAAFNDLIFMVSGKPINQVLSNEVDDILQAIGSNVAGGES